MNRRWLFILPNLFTVSSIFCGIYSITLSTGATGVTAADDYFRAAIAILFGMFFDGCDGRVARLTRTESEFGIQLDSLADVITFGAAPALLLYNWALAPMGALGVFVAGIYASCGALRLARFNVLAAREEGSSKYFIGLPIPLAAGVVVATVVADTRAPEPLAVGPLAAAFLALVLSSLMVSNIRYQSFKTFRPHGRDLLVLVAVLSFGALVAVQVRPSMVLLAYFSGYLLFGLVEEVLLRRRGVPLRLASGAAGQGGASAPQLVDPVDEDEAA